MNYVSILRQVVVGSFDPNSKHLYDLFCVLIHYGTAGVHCEADGWTACHLMRCVCLLGGRQRSSGRALPLLYSRPHSIQR